MAKKIKSVSFEQALKFDELYSIKEEVQKKKKNNKKKNDYKIIDEEKTVIEKTEEVIDIAEFLKEEE